VNGFDIDVSALRSFVVLAIVRSYTAAARELAISPSGLTKRNPRAESAWPLPSTRWTDLYLDGDSLVDRPGEPGTVSFDALGQGITFTLAPLSAETEITGPLSARLFVESSTVDADLFLVVRAFSPEGEEVVFQGAIGPFTPVSQGWLRASHRKLDPELSTDYRPFHSHDE
jgi:predicted acyl esterase